MSGDLTRLWERIEGREVSARSRDMSRSCGEEERERQRSHVQRDLLEVRNQISYLKLFMVS